MSRIILDLCGGTGSWSKPYRDAGYDVRLITLPEMDVRRFEYIGGVHGILAAPPCTVFAGSGARWWKERHDPVLLDALSVVDACLRIIAVSRPRWWALENPVGRLRKWIGPPAMAFNPCDYGDPYTKKTLLWGDFTPPLMSPVAATEGSKMHLLPPSEKRQELRSMTPQGFARAFFEANP